MTEVPQMLDEREARYGSFEGHAKIAQGLKEVMANTTAFQMLAADQREALEMIQHKVARILNGDPDYADNWVDIAGYATLITRRLEKVA